MLQSEADTIYNNVVSLVNSQYLPNLKTQLQTLVINSPTPNPPTPVAGESPDGFEITGGVGQITDSKGNVWTVFLDNGSGTNVHRNGNNNGIGFPNVKLLRYCNHSVVGVAITDSSIWQFSDTTGWAKVSSICAKTN